MYMSYEAAPPPPNRNGIRDSVRALPVVAQNPLLDERAALAAFFDAKRFNQQLYDTVRQQIVDLRTSFDAGLDEYRGTDGFYHLPAHVLHAVIARSAIAGASQAIIGIGTALREINELNAAIAERPGGDHGGDAILPPAA